MQPGSRIVCVDDDAAVREALEGLLLAVGFEVVAFASAEDFLQSVEVGNISCLIADVTLGGMSGIQLQKHLVGAGRQIPTIIITAVADDRLRAQAFEAGAVGFLRKPITEQGLLSTIHLALSCRPGGAANALLV